jgi:hypothetical protein
METEIEDRLIYESKLLTSLSPFNGGVLVTLIEGHTKIIFEKFFNYTNNTKQIAYTRNLFTHLN